MSLVDRMSLQTIIYAAAMLIILDIATLIIGTLPDTVVSPLSINKSAFAAQQIETKDLTSFHPC